MKITPLDIQQQNFQVRLRGYDREEVQEFLRCVSETVEELVRENADLKEQADRLDKEVSDLRRKDASLNDLLVTTQKMAENLKETARREADLILKEAELKSEELMKHAHADFRTLQRDIQELRRDRILAIEKLRSLLQVLTKMVEMEEIEMHSMEGEAHAKNIGGGR